MTTTAKTHIHRRTFFKSSAVAGGGMLLGFNWLSACQAPEREVYVKELEMPENWFDINAYVKVGNNGVVTIFNPNPEIGQNVKTSMPMIIAEEMDVDWENVMVEQAALNTDWYARQVAGGSQSIRQSWEALRTAGATAKAMLVGAAAKEWGVEASNCTVDKGVISGPSGQSTTYGDIASAAAEMEVPEEAPLKDPKDFKIIGTSRKNVDGRKIATGAPLFGLDTPATEVGTERPGMLYAVVKRPPKFGQKLASLDDAAARAVNGVQDVFTFEDNKIAVVANSTWAAMKGQKALRVSWTDDKPESTSYHSDELRKLLDKKSTEPRRKDGDVEKAFAEADEVIERIYEAPFLPHNCLEPMNFYAHVTEDAVFCHGPIQTPEWQRNRIAEQLEIEPTQVHVGMTRQGGGFGRRLYGDFCTDATAVSKHTKTPIQLVFTREDDMMDGIYRPASMYKIQAAIKDGAITGYKLTEACVNNNMYGLIPHFFPAGAIENLQIDTHKFDSNITTGAWRAPYTNFLAFAEQSFFDEVAEQLGMDAVQMRLDLLENAIAVAEADENIEYSPKRLQGVIRLAAEKGNWGNPAEGVYQGFSAYYSHNTHVAEMADIVMENGIPKVQRVVCAVDCGLLVNPIAAENQCQGGVVDGIGHAMYGDFAFDDGAPSSANFDTYRLIRNSESPMVEVHFVESDESPTGLGEPTLPPAGGAIANALYKATGKRIYSQPFIKEEALIG